MRTVMVTGGAGFIGSCLSRQLALAPETRVIVVDKLTYAGDRSALDAVCAQPDNHLEVLDICDAARLAELFRQYAPDAVCHLAAESHVDRSIEGPEAFLQSNVVGTFRLLECALDSWRSLPESRRAAFRLLHVSTDEVYGSLGPTGAFTESSPYAPNSPYAASKAAADHFVRAFGRTYRLPVITTHCSNNYGPYQFPEKLIPLVTLNALNGEPLPVYGDGSNVRDWIHVEDHCRALQQVLDRGKLGDCYNIGANCEKSNLAVVRAICAAVDRLRPGLPHAPCEQLITFVADRPGHDRRYALDSSKLEQALGWSPEIDFTEGLQQTVAWYLGHQPWVEKMQRYQRVRRGQVWQGAGHDPKGGSRAD